MWCGVVLVAGGWGAAGWVGAIALAMVVASVVVVVAIRVRSLAPVVRSAHAHAASVVGEVVAVQRNLAAALGARGRATTRCVAARRTWVAAGAVRTLASTPLGALRSHTSVTGVRTSVLASAGYTSVAQVLAAPQSRLEQVSGIGPVTSAAIKQAASTMLAAAAKDIDATVVHRSGDATHDHYVTSLWLQARLRAVAGSRLADLDRLEATLSDLARTNRGSRWMVVWWLSTQRRREARQARIADLSDRLADPGVGDLKAVGAAMVSASHDLADIDEVWHWVEQRPDEVRSAIADADRVGAANRGSLDRWERTGVRDLSVSLPDAVGHQLRTVDLPRRGIEVVPAAASGVSDQTALYRLYDKTGGLLYVGISNNVHNRIRTHRVDKFWGPNIARIAIEQHPTRAAALRAEETAIRRERPRHNVIHNR